MTRKTETLNDFKARTEALGATSGVRFATLVHRPEAKVIAHAGRLDGQHLAVRAALLLYEYPPAHADTRISVDVKNVVENVEEHICVVYIDHECSLVIGIIKGDPISKSLLRMGKRFRDAWEFSQPMTTGAP